MGMFKRGVGPLLSVVRPSLDPFLILVRRTHSRRLCRVGRGLILFGEWTSYTPPSRSLPLRGFTTSSANALFISRTARSITQVAKHGACRPPPGPQGPGVGCRARWPQVEVIKTPAELCLRYVTNAGRFAHFKLSKPKIEIWAEDLVRLWGSDNQWAALQRVGH